MKHPWVKGVQGCTKKGSHLFPWGDKYEIAKKKINSQKEDNVFFLLIND